MIEEENMTYFSYFDVTLFLKNLYNIKYNIYFAIKIQ